MKGLEIACGTEDLGSVSSTHIRWLKLPSPGHLYPLWVHSQVKMYVPTQTYSQLKLLKTCLKKIRVKTREQIDPDGKLTLFFFL